MVISSLKWFRLSGGMLLLSVLTIASDLEGSSYPIPDTDQSICYDSLYVIAPPSAGEAFCGQDAQFQGAAPSYQDNGDGTVTDLNTGLMWQQGLSVKMSWADAVAGAGSCTIGGYSDWRLPTIKELYSLILFSGTDPSGPTPVNLIPFIDTDYFEFEYGDTLSGERLIDAQYWSSTVYQGLTMMGDSTAFGVNFADGRIKGYPGDESGPPSRSFLMTAFVRYVRGNTYGENQFQDNGDGTVTDLATGLMWQQADDGVGRNWEEALDYSENLTLAGYDDWRLPNAHELQSIVDYTRSMQETDSPAIDPVFGCTQITDEGGNPNYGFYWTGTTHAAAVPSGSGGFAVYVSFGEALGWLMLPDSTYMLTDVHGAGAQRSDPKTGDPAQYPHGHGPQGDVVRIYNFSRCVRDTGSSGVPEGEEGGNVSLSVLSGNPSSSAVSLFYTSPGGNVQIEIFDSAGRIVETLQTAPSGEGSGTVEWLPDAPGLYFARLSSETGIASRKILVVR